MAVFFRNLEAFICIHAILSRGHRGGGRGAVPCGHWGYNAETGAILSQPARADTGAS